MRWSFIRAAMSVVLAAHQGNEAVTVNDRTRKAQRCDLVVQGQARHQMVPAKVSTASWHAVKVWVRAAARSKQVAEWLCVAAPTIVFLRPFIITFLNDNVKLYQTQFTV
ncbi:hypothetical protein BB8028_0006g01730 [Beauveria bassiana]|uniref:Secreted protein n=1 Tax=Beauveria bassiana TaxID=176275 RepID=A0A2S7YI49_BEABA|nr:hypothetical protein BB8028_0006g01730 [Beauveria bassiana]